jgi:class 3 adenylate cyclase/pimeloyl-ACP methyl ester carboxylesterase
MRWAIAHNPRMEPQIRYCTTEDGVNIAYTTTGDGPPVLYCANVSISMQSWLGDTISLGRELAAKTRHTTFDHAGIGASQRNVNDFSLSAQVREIEAVAARLADDPFTLIGNGTGSASAALYAARHPDRVRSLVCLVPALPMIHDLATEAREHWSLARRRLAGFTFPDGPVSTQRWYSTAIRDSMTAEVAAAYWEEFAGADLKAIYQRIPVPTLLCVPATGPVREASLALASLVPDCRVAVASAADGAAAAILEFMGVDAAPNNPPLCGESSSPASPAAASAMAVILFTDIVSSTALTERMGDAPFRDASRALDAGLRTAIRDAGGAAIDGKLLGDGVLATFPSAAQAIDGARRCLALSAASELGLHIGLHAGDVIREDNNVYGGAVNIASRICGLSAPGEILVSDTVRSLARTSAGVRFEDRGEHDLKGVADAQRVFAVNREQ